MTSDTPQHAGAPNSPARDSYGAMGQLSLSGVPLPVFDAPVRQPGGPAPPRRAHSVRRTMTLDAVWPEGQRGLVQFFGDCRDCVTTQAHTPPTMIAQSHIDAIVDDRVIRSIAATPPHPHADALSGARAGGHLRARIAEVMPVEKAHAAPLYLMLDDLAGATLVCRWAWEVNRDAPGSAYRREVLATRQVMEGVCIGFRPGSSALDMLDAPVRSHNASHVGSLVNPADPLGWHELRDRGGVNFRRARRIDVWREGGLLHIDSGFQDSVSLYNDSDDGRLAIHEYRIFATADLTTGRLLSVEAVPGTLPYAECRAAPTNAVHLVGAPIDELRDRVLELLGKTAGCTHLNDMLRALADVPALAARIA